MSGNSVQLLGARLLQGWCMLGVSCAQCNVPLMEDKRNNKIECVSCNSKFQREDDVFGISTIVRYPEEEDEKQDIGSEDKNQNNTIESNRIEEQNNTPETPQMGDQGEEENEDYNITHRKDPVEQQKNDTYIKNMGEKLLMGWALLGEECPNCNTPLMRDKNSAMWCLRCDMRVVREEEFNPKVHFDVKQQNNQTNTTNNTNNNNNSNNVMNNSNNQNTNNNNTNNTNNNNTVNNNIAQPTPVPSNKSEIPSQSLDEKSPLLSKELSSIHEKIIFPHHKLPSDHPLIINASTFPDKKIPKKSSQSVKKKKNKTTTSTTSTTTTNNLVKQPNLTNILPLNNNNTNNNTNINPFDDNSDLSSPRNLGSPSFTSLQIVHETKWRAINAINQKLAVATQLLESTTDLPQSSALLRFITEC